MITIRCRPKGLCPEETKADGGSEQEWKRESENAQRGRDEGKAKQIESVSAPIYSRSGFDDAQLSSGSLFTILPPLRLSEKQLFSVAVMALVQIHSYSKVQTSATQFSVSK